MLDRFPLTPPNESVNFAKAETRVSNMSPHFLGMGAGGGGGGDRRRRRRRLDQR